jgi:hypothetical protein
MGSAAERSAFSKNSRIAGTEDDLQITVDLRLQIADSSRLIGGWWRQA